jgi:hypothetical protein
MKYSDVSNSKQQKIEQARAAPNSSPKPSVQPNPTNKHSTNKPVTLRDLKAAARARKAGAA